MESGTCKDQKSGQKEVIGITFAKSDFAINEIIYQKKIGECEGIILSISQFI